MKFKVGDKVNITFKNGEQRNGEIYSYLGKDVYKYSDNLRDYKGQAYSVKVGNTCYIAKEEDLIKNSVTNRQWLESLSDEELAGFLTSNNWACKDIEVSSCWLSGSDISCRQCKKQWLQAEHSN